LAIAADRDFTDASACKHDAGAGPVVIARTNFPARPRAASSPSHLWRFAKHGSAALPVAARALRGGFALLEGLVTQLPNERRNGFSSAAVVLEGGCFSCATVCKS